MLGDGDGRFLAALLQQNPSLAVDAVDTSSEMLRLLRRRCLQSACETEARLRTHCIDALAYLAEPSDKEYDLVVTHFFLDCHTQPEVDALAAAVSKRVASGAIWVVSDFRIPPGTMRFPARLLIRGLYLAFRILTGLRANRLPNHAFALEQAGFVRIGDTQSLFGILTTELWTLRCLVVETCSL